MAARKTKPPKPRQPVSRTPRVLRPKPATQTPSQGSLQLQIQAQPPLSPPSPPQKPLQLIIQVGSPPRPTLSFPFSIGPTEKFGPRLMHFRRALDAPGGEEWKFVFWYRYTETETRNAEQEGQIIDWDKSPVDLKAYGLMDASVIEVFPGYGKEDAVQEWIDKYKARQLIKAQIAEDKRNWHNPVALAEVEKRAVLRRAEEWRDGEVKRWKGPIKDAREAYEKNQKEWDEWADSMDMQAKWFRDLRTASLGKRKVPEGDVARGEVINGGGKKVKLGGILGRFGAETAAGPKIQIAIGGKLAARRGQSMRGALHENNEMTEGDGDRRPVIDLTVQDAAAQKEGANGLGSMSAPPHSLAGEGHDENHETLEQDKENQQQADYHAGEARDENYRVLDHGNENHHVAIYNDGHNHEAAEQAITDDHDAATHQPHEQHEANHDNAATLHHDEYENNSSGNSLVDVDGDGIGQLLESHTALPGSTEAGSHIDLLGPTETDTGAELLKPTEDGHVQPPQHEDHDMENADDDDDGFEDAMLSAFDQSFMNAESTSEPVDSTTELVRENAYGEDTGLPTPPSTERAEHGKDDKVDTDADGDDVMADLFGEDADE